MASSLQSHRNNAFTAIVIEMVLVSVMGQFDRKIDCLNGCTRPLMGPYVSFEITKNVSQVYNWSNCFPIHTELLSVCKANELYQFGPNLKREDLFRKCTGNGWRDGLDILQTSLPNCVKKEEHCHSPPAIHNQNIFIEIQGRNFTIDDNYTSAFYSLGTTATYKCKDSKPNAKENKRVFRCTKLVKAKWGGISEDTIGYTWTEIQPNGKDLVCDLPKEISVDDGEKITIEPPTTFRFKPVPNPNNEAHKDHISSRSSDSGDNSLSRNLIIGICSCLGFVLIAVLFGVLFKNRTRIGQQYKDIANHTAQPTFQSMPGEKNQQDHNFANKEENYQYVNIIPIAVNQDTIYAEVETGPMDGYSIPAMTRHVDDDQTTVYAEIHH